MVIHTGHIFISVMHMLYGTKIGCIGQYAFPWCFGLINAPKHSDLIILDAHVFSLMTDQTLV